MLESLFHDWQNNLRPSPDRRRCLRASLPLGLGWRLHRSPGQTGEALFAENCVTCHGPGLEGDGEAPPLSGGEPFWAGNGKPLTALFDKIHKEMPHNKPGTLSPEADLLAYVLQFDKFPAGASELPHDSAAMNQIRYEPEEVRLEEIRASQPACRVTNQTTSPSNSRSTR
jgi:cytochrome c